jgi:hypothetical protein
MLSVVCILLQQVPHTSPQIVHVPCPTIKNKNGTAESNSHQPKLSTQHEMPYYGHLPFRIATLDCAAIFTSISKCKKKQQQLQQFIIARGLISKSEGGREGSNRSSPRLKCK